MYRKLTLALVVTAVVIGVGMRSREMFKPWSGMHRAWGGAMYGNIARNMLRYGPLETGLAPITNTGPVTNRDEYTYYYHYPPLLVSMVAASYKMFGVHEGGARLVPLAFSLLTLGLVFVFARSFWGDRPALIAVVVAAFLPVETYYADHVDVYGPPAAFFSALAIAGYAWWFRDREGRHLALCLGALLAGFLTSWYAYFAAGLLVVHALWLSPRERRPARWIPMTFLAGGVAVFVTFLLHRHFLLTAGGSEVAGSLLEKLRARTAYLNLGIPTPEGLIPVGPMRFVTHLLSDLVRMYGPVTLLLVAAWLATVTRRAVLRTLEPRDVFLLLLIGYGVLHGLAFPMLLPGHDFLWRSFSVGFAIAAAALLDRMYTTWRLRAPGQARALLLVALALVTVLNISLSLGLVDRSGTGQRLKLWGTFVREATSPETRVLLPGGEDQVFRYYVDRNTTFRVDTPEALDAALADSGATVMAIAERDLPRFPALLDALDARGSQIVWHGLRLYRFAGSEANP